MGVTTLQVTCTVDTREAADALAHDVVDLGLAACAQVVGPITSTYRWQGAIETAEEFLLLMKTTDAAFARLRDELVERHPYDVPEVLAMPVADGGRDYLEWISSNVR
ncbi:MAG TPA: divalent-cation tolerance protein CutA [Actinomycetota bacterium]|nr:divalent-cation tolerance protein CutA [Actinomycetota bacterium]